MYDKDDVRYVPPLPSDNPDFLMMPRILFGHQSETRKALRPIIKQAWAQGSWGDLLSSLELVPAAEFGNEIYFGKPLKAYHGDPKAWHLYHSRAILRDLAYTESERGSDKDATLRYDDLVVEGMNHFWFAVGMLERDGGGVLIASRELVPQLKWRAERMLGELVRWIPEMWLIGTNLRHKCSGIAIETTTLSAMHWLHEILVLGCVIDKCISLPDIEEQYGGDIIDALLDIGLIERAGNGRFALRRSTEIN